MAVNLGHLSEDKMKEISEPRHAEPHMTESSTMRDFVFGFGDGINTSLGIAAGVGGANIASDIVILAALVGMFTGAKAMAVQNYLAVKSHRQLLESEIAREKWEIENKPDAERKEIEDIYKAKGFTGKDLEALIMFVSFLAGGMLPIIPFFFGSGYSALAIAVGISVTASFIVGAVKSRMAQTGIVKGGLEMAGLGTGVALIGFGIGNELASLGIINI